MMAIMNNTMNNKTTMAIMNNIMIMIITINNQSQIDYFIM